MYDTVSGFSTTSELRRKKAGGLLGLPLELPLCEFSISFLQTNVYNFSQVLNHRQVMAPFIPWGPGCVEDASKNRTFYNDSMLTATINILSRFVTSK